MKPSHEGNQQESKGPPSAPLPPPAYYQEEAPLLGGAGAGDASSSSWQQQQQNPQYPRIIISNEHHHNSNRNNWDPEAAAAAEFASQFAEAEARAGFVRRVLSIVSAQLVLTAAMTLLFFYSRGARSFLISNAWTVPVSWVVGFAVSTTVRFFFEISVQFLREKRYRKEKNLKIEGEKKNTTPTDLQPTTNSSLAARQLAGDTLTTS